MFLVLWVGVGGLFQKFWCSETVVIWSCLVCHLLFTTGFRLTPGSFLNSDALTGLVSLHLHKAEK